ncbi:nucleoporin GLE1-like [Cotesia glomerata]|nr:nucleoporin GLE1-like [Cotesia glomerata]
MKELIEQNRKLNAIIEKQRYDSHDQHLQREREQQQIFEEEERQRQLMELHQRRKLLKRAQREREELEREQQKQEQQERQQQERERREQEQRDQQQRNREQRERERRERERRERGNQIDDEEDDLIDQVYIGRQIFISILAYTEAFREYRPSKFITIMSHAIWGYENLALRAVKVGKRNARKLPLTPAKKLVLEKAIQEIFKTKKFIRRHGDRGAE